MTQILSSRPLGPQIYYLHQAFGDHSADVDATSTAKGRGLRRLGRVGGVNDFLTGPLAEGINTKGLRKPCRPKGRNVRI